MQVGLIITAARLCKGGDALELFGMPHKSEQTTADLALRFTGNGCTWFKFSLCRIVEALMLHAAKSHFTEFFIPNAVLPAKPAPLFRLPYVSSRVSSVHTPRLPSRKS